MQETLYNIITNTAFLVTWLPIILSITVAAIVRSVQLAQVENKLGLALHWALAPVIRHLWSLETLRPMQKPAQPILTGTRIFRERRNNHV